MNNTETSFSKKCSVEQKKVVLSDLINHSPIGIIAWSGSWKSTTIVNMVWHHLENNNIDGKNALMISFTNKSAKELKEKIVEKLKSKGEEVTATTFHSFSYKMLKEWFDIKKSRIIDSDESEKLLKKILSEKQAPTLKWMEDTCIRNNNWDKEWKKKSSLKEWYDKQKDILSDSSSVMSIISKSKNTWQNIFELIYSDIFRKNPSRIPYKCSKYTSYIDVLSNKTQYDELIKKVETENGDKSKLNISNVKSVYSTLLEYENRKRKMKLYDFDDLMVALVDKLKENEDIRKKIDERYKYVFIDEFQDVNFIQMELLKEINKDNNYLVMVWDSDQAIYSFRWCDSSYFLNINEIFPNIRMFYLVDNYRSDWHIVEIANQCIVNNTERFDKTMVATKDNKNQVWFIYWNNEREVAFNIYEQIKFNIPKEDWGDVAILYRNNMHSMDVQKLFIEYGLPHIIYGGMSLLEKEQIKDYISLLSLFNAIDELNFERVTLLVPKVWKKKVEKIWSEMVDCDYEGKIDVLAKYEEFKHIYKTLTLYKSNISDGLQYFLDNFMDDYMKKKYENYDERYSEVESFIQMVEEGLKSWKSLEDFLSNIVLNIKDEEDSEDWKIVLSTIHRSKGLEWKYVFLIKNYEGYFPSKKTYENSNESDFLENEERNMFYVAMTRAKEQLYFCFSNTTYSFQDKRVYDNYHSKFTNEVSSHIVWFVPKEKDVDDCFY